MDNNPYSTIDDLKREIADLKKQIKEKDHIILEGKLTVDAYMALYKQCKYILYAKGLDSEIKEDFMEKEN